MYVFNWSFSLYWNKKIVLFLTYNIIKKFLFHAGDKVYIIFFS
jgi:hypothetical protein